MLRASAKPDWSQFATLTRHEDLHRIAVGLALPQCSSYAFPTDLAAQALGACWQEFGCFEPSYLCFGDSRAALSVDTKGQDVVTRCSKTVPHKQRRSALKELAAPSPTQVRALEQPVNFSKTCCLCTDKQVYQVSKTFKNNKRLGISTIRAPIHSRMRSGETSPDTSTTTKCSSIHSRS